MKSVARGRRGWRWADDLFADTRHSLRMLRKNPVFTAVAVATLGLGIGANTAVFSIVHAVLLRPLPFPGADNLVRINFNKPRIGLRDVWFSVPELNDLRTSGVFSDVSAFIGAANNMGGNGRPVRVELLVVGSNYFSMLGAKPQLGRLFGPQDSVPGFADAVVVSDAFWRSEFGADPNIVGRKLQLDKDPYTIAGVLPAAFRHPDRADAGSVEVFSATGFSGPPYPKPLRGTRVVGRAALGRLRPGIGLEQAQARLNNLASELRREYPNDYPARAGWSIQIQPLQDALVGGVRPLLVLLMGTVTLIIVIAAVNVANLLLARANGRRHEIAVRLAIGAGSARIVRQMLTEAVVLSLLAGAAGVAMAIAAWGLILRIVPDTLPRLNEVNVSWLAIAYALLISLVTGIVFGLAPAIQLAKPDLFSTIRDGNRGSGFSAKNSRLRSILIISELALSVVLLIGACLLIRTLLGLLHENPGFNPSQVVVATLRLANPNDPNDKPYPDAKSKTAFIREALRRVRSIPGVTAAAMTSHLPMVTATPAISVAPIVEGRSLESTQGLTAEASFVSPDYFKVMQAALIQGRFFEETDEAGKINVVIVDESTARRFWPSQDPIGRRLSPSSTETWMTVVGIIRDIKHNGLDRDGIPHIYAPIYQYQLQEMNLALRTSLPAATLGPAIQREIQGIDAGQPIYNVRTMEAVIADSLSSRRFAADLVGLFAAVALVLSLVGLYGLLDYMVGQRSTEIAIRLALGAQPADVRKMVFRHGLLLAGAGIIAGLVGAAVTARLLTTLLYGVRPFDSAIFIGVPVLLLVVACLATYVPARRATKVDPMTALRVG
jgi:predicted permease